jgi:formylglycine-generating enzyme required for sulfatase activity
VGIYPTGATPEGVSDLSGNVWEWCADWYSGDYYQNCLALGTVLNPVGVEQGQSRLLRGGSWDYVTGDARAAIRFNYFPDLRVYDFGFRVLLFLRQD